MADDVYTNEQAFYDTYQSKQQVLFQYLEQAKDQKRQLTNERKQFEPHHWKYRQLSKELTDINHQINEYTALLKECRREQKNFLYSMQKKYAKFSEFTKYNLLRKQKISKSQLDILKNDHNVNTAAPARILSDLRYLTQCIQNNVDIDSLTVYKGEIIIIRDFIYRHLIKTVKQICKKGNIMYTNGRMSVAQADDFQCALKGMFEETCSNGRLYIVKWAVALMSMCYLDLLRGKQWIGHRYPDQTYINAVFHDEHWKIYIDKLKSKQYTQRRWDTLRMFIDRLLFLVREWIRLHSEEYVHFMSEGSNRWILWKVCEIGSFLYGRKWRWICYECDQICTGTFSGRYNVFYCDFCWYIMKGIFLHVIKICPLFWRLILIDWNKAIKIAINL